MYIVDELESFNFRYNPSLAEEMITTALSNVGAKKINGMWTYDGKDIELIAFIRSDDPVRKSIGEILSYELERIGFKVIKDSRTLVILTRHSLTFMVQIQLT